MKWGAVSAVTIFGLALSACGGGSSSPGVEAGNANTGTGAGGGSTPIDAVGRIDAFGSVFVDGIEFDTDSARFRVDDDDAFDDSALSVGMIVRIKGSHDSSGHGRADEVYYDDEIKGPIADLMVDPGDDSIKRFTIFGTTIVASAATTLFRGEDGSPYSYEDLANGDHIEVSGDLDGDTILATFIEKEDDDDVEVKGTVSGLTGTGFVLTLGNGNTLDVTFGAGIVLPPDGLMEGQFVEVEGTVPDPAGAPDALLAVRIELEDQHDFDDDDDRDDNSGPGNGDDDDGEARIEGILNFDGAVWSVRMTALEFGSGTEFRPASLESAIADGSADGLRVKVRGDVVGAVLHVERIETEGDGRGGNELEVKGFVESVVTDDEDGTSELTISFAPAVGTVTVLVNNETLLKNDDGLFGFEISDLVPGSSFVEIHGHIDAAGTFIAGVLEAEDGPDEYEIEGPLDQDGFIDGVSISVLGVRFVLDDSTLFEDGKPVNGDLVDVEDFDRDGMADEVDIED